MKIGCISSLFENGNGKCLDSVEHSVRTKKPRENTAGIVTTHLKKKGNFIIAVISQLSQANAKKLNSVLGKRKHKQIRKPKQARSSNCYHKSISQETKGICVVCSESHQRKSAQQKRTAKYCETCEEYVHEKCWNVHAE